MPEIQLNIHVWLVILVQELYSVGCIEGIYVYTLALAFIYNIIIDGQYVSHLPPHMFSHMRTCP